MPTDRNNALGGRASSLSRNNNNLHIFLSLHLEFPFLRLEDHAHYLRGRRRRLRRPHCQSSTTTPTTTTTGPPMTTTTTTNQNYQQQERQPQPQRPLLLFRRRRFRLLYFDVTATQRRIRNCIEDGIDRLVDFFASSSSNPLDPKTVNTMSISGLLYWHAMMALKEHQVYLWESVQFLLPMPNAIDWALIFRMALSLPPSIGGIFILSVTCAVLVFRWNLREACILACLVAVFCVEVMVPLSFVLCLICYIFQFISGPTAISILLLITGHAWLSLRLCRRLLYPTLGGD